MGKTKRGKGTKLMAVADRAGLPIAVRVTAVRAYDSDPLDARLAEQGIELIAPHRSNIK